MKIVDGFIFNDELDLLELRLMELYDYVDEFVIVEMAHNFMQKPKLLHFHENQGRFDKWASKIRNIVVKNYPIEPHPAMEHHQRRAIAHGFIGLSPNDVIMMGDLDEIPSREVLDNVRRLPPEHPFTCLQRLYYYYVNCEQACPWPGTVIAPRHSLPKAIDCQQLRDDRHNFPKLWKSGWHFSWLGPVDNIRAKLDAIDVAKDAEMYNTPEITKPSSSDSTFIQRCLDSGEDLFGRKDDYSRKTFVPLEPGIRQPHSINQWLEQYPQYYRNMEWNDGTDDKRTEDGQKEEAAAGISGK